MKADIPKLEMTSGYPLFTSQAIRGGLRDLILFDINKTEKCQMVKNLYECILSM